MIVILTTLLILLCLVIVLLILIQRTSGGMGSALGGGAADQVLGAGSAAQLTKFTVYGIVGFFIMAFVLYGFYQDQSADSDSLIRTGLETPILESGPGSDDASIPNAPISDPSSLPVSPEPPVDLPPASPVEQTPPSATKQEKAPEGNESN